MAKGKRGSNQVGGIAGERLRSFIERIERLEAEKRTIAADVGEVFNEAKGSGFDPKTMRQILRLCRMDQDERDEFEALLDIYKAALGMLGGTPLDAAVRRLSPKDPPPPDGGSGEGAADPPAADEPAASPATIETARAQGREAAKSGQSVTANPFTARDPRRAAWDEGWCLEAGSDGFAWPPRREPR